MTHPFLIRKTDDGKDYELVWHEKRLIVAKEAKIKTIPAIVVDIDDAQMVKIFVEPDILFRRDPRPLEEAALFAQAIKIPGFSKKEIVFWSGTTIGHVNNYLKLLDLPKKVKDRMCESNRISYSHIRLIMKYIKNENQMVEIIEKIEKDALSVRQTKKLISQFNEGKGNTLSDVNELIENYRTSSKIYHGVATRYLQDYLNFYVYRKQLLYKLKRSEIADHIFELIRNTVSVNHKQLQATLMPISLAEAYYEYHYGIFSQQQLS